MLKLKSADSEILNVGLGLAKLSGEDRLPGLFETHIGIFGFENSHLREIEFYRRAGSEMLSFCPAVYGIKVEKDRELFAVLMEDLSGCSHLDTVNDPSRWDDESIRAVLDDLAGMHAAYLGRTDSVPAEIGALGLDGESLLSARDLLYELSSYNAGRFPGIVTPECAEFHRRFLDNLPDAVRTMEAGPLTLTHNDFNTRNICLREKGAEPRLITYDWELPSVQNPQRDLIEFLVYALPDNAPMEMIDLYSGFYRESLERRAEMELPPGEFGELLVFNALILAVRRFNLYLLAHNVMQFSFMERVYRNLMSFIKNKFI